MNFFPFQFLDDVAAMLPDLPNFAKLVISDEDFSVWAKAIENERCSRQTFVLHFAFGHEEIRYTFRGGQRSFAFEDVKALNIEKVQVHAICVHPWVPGLSVDRSAFKTIIDYIWPLMNCPKLKLKVNVFDAMEFLNDIEFYEIAPGKIANGYSLTNSFLSKQFKTGCLQKCFARPARKWTREFKEDVEEFLTTQSFREIRLGNYVSKKLFGRLFALTCDYQKKIYFFADFNVLEESEKLRQRENRAGVRVELVEEGTLSYVMTISSDRAVKL